MKKIYYIIPIILLLASGLFLVKCKKDEPMKENFVTKMIDYRFIPLVEAQIGGKKAYFLLDTGASISMIDINSMSRYGIKKYKNVDTGIIGYGGVTTGTYSLSPFKTVMGNTTITGEWVGKDLKTIVETVHKNTGRRILGIMGNDKIAPNGFILNFKNGEITK